MTDKIGKITEGTLLPLSFVIAIICSVLWLGAIRSDATANSKAISDLQSKQSEHDKIVQSIDKRLSRIEGKLGVADAER